MNRLLNHPPSLLMLATGLAMVLALATCATGCGTTSRQRRAGLMVTADLAAACDTSSTMVLSDGGRWDVGRAPGRVFYEADPALGRAPTAGTLVLGLGLALAVNAGAAYKLPEWATWLALGAEIGVETAVNAGNARWTGPCGIGGRR